MTTNHPNSGGARDMLISEFAGDPDMQELIKLFVDEMPQRIDVLLDCWRRGAVIELRRVAHQMKGACGGYGFPQVGVVAGELESTLAELSQRGDAGGLEGLREQIDDLVSLCRRISAESPHPI